ncbi:hypothetical protein J6590_036263 [Homalodisca vitripennis]|nr:hypothetical protein J6590_036263 [Homalodisca vitripennis]
MSVVDRSIESRLALSSVNDANNLDMGRIIAAGLPDCLPTKKNHNVNSAGSPGEDCEAVRWRGRPQPRKPANRRTAARTWSDAVRVGLRPIISRTPLRYHQRDRRNSPYRLYCDFLDPRMTLVISSTGSPLEAAPTYCSAA